MKALDTKNNGTHGNESLQDGWVNSAKSSRKSQPFVEGPELDLNRKSKVNVHPEEGWDNRK